MADTPLASFVALLEKAEAEVFKTGQSQQALYVGRHCEYHVMIVPRDDFVLKEKGDGGTPEHGSVAERSGQ